MKSNILKKYEDIGVSFQVSESGLKVAGAKALSKADREKIRKQAKQIKDFLLSRERSRRKHEQLQTDYQEVFKALREGYEFTTVCPICQKPQGLCVYDSWRGWAYSCCYGCKRSDLERILEKEAKK